MVDMDLFDVEFFIDQVKERPAIWNTKSSEYFDRDKRSQAWNELCHIFVPRYAEKSLSSKKLAAKKLRRKWKSYRDSYSRDFRRKADAKYQRKPYKHHDNLSFLNSVMDLERTKENKTAEIEIEVDPEPVDIIMSNTISTRSRHTEPNIVYDDLSKAEEEMVNYSEACSASQSEVDEGDRNFILSLLPHFRHIPQDSKLEAQMEILMVLKKYKLPHQRTNPYYSKTTSRGRITDMNLNPGYFPGMSHDNETLNNEDPITISIDSKMMYY